MKKIILTLVFVFVFTTSMGLTKTEASWAEVAWQVVKEGTNYIYHAPATVTYGPEVNSVSSGVIKFSNDKPIFRHGATLTKTTHEIDAVATNSLLSFTNKITISIRKDGSSGYLKAQNMGPGAHLYYKGSTGKFSVEYSDSGNNKWNLWLGVWHYTSLKTCYTPPCPIQTNNVTPIDESFKALNVSDNKIYDVINIEEGVFSTPSDDFLLEDKRNRNLNQQSYTFKELESLGYDEELDTIINNFKGLFVGDKVKFSDVIESVRYNEKEDITYFGFTDFYNETSEWPFKGDLTSVYNIGDNLKLKFQVLEIGENTGLETLDYIQYGQKNDGQPPIIDLFIDGEI